MMLSCEVANIAKVKKVKFAQRQKLRNRVPIAHAESARQNPRDAHHENLQGLMRI